MAQALISARVDEQDKQRFEAFCEATGMNISVAVNMFIKAVLREGKIPFSISMPEAPRSLDTTKMSETELLEKIEAGMADIEAGRVRDARDVFADFRNGHNYDV